MRFDVGDIPPSPSPAGIAGELGKEAMGELHPAPRTAIGTSAPLPSSSGLSIGISGAGVSGDDAGVVGSGSTSIGALQVETKKEKPVRRPKVLPLHLPLPLNLESPVVPPGRLGPSLLETLARIAPLLCEVAVPAAQVKREKVEMFEVAGLPLFYPILAAKGVQ